MPPKKNLEDVPAENQYGLSDTEITFLIDCIMNAVGTITVDTRAIAAARGQKNAGSISNRLTTIKKKYNLPITGSSAGASRKLTVDPTGPVIPSKNKITKTKVKTAKKRKTVKSESESGEEELKVKSDSEDDEENAEDEKMADEENAEEEEITDEENAEE